MHLLIRKKSATLQLNGVLLEHRRVVLLLVQQSGLVIRNWGLNRESMIYQRSCPCRYADRAKAIMCKAVINEDPNAKVILDSLLIELNALISICLSFAVYCFVFVYDHITS